MKKLTVIKIGGKVIDDKTALSRFLSAFAGIKGPKILVHGGGKIASDFGQRMGVAPEMINGRRITNAETLELVTMVYGGLVNKNIVAQLQVKGEIAIGLSGADANILQATKRPVGETDFGFVGDIIKENVDSDRLHKFLEQGLTPVFCPLTHDGQGNLLNTNADTIACIISAAMSERYHVKLTYCFEQKGVLNDLENQTVMSKINWESYLELKKAGIISEGMIPKLDNAFDALRSGVSHVNIGCFSEVSELTMDGNTGTKIEL